MEPLDLNVLFYGKPISQTIVVSISATSTVWHLKNHIGGQLRGPVASDPSFDPSEDIALWQVQLPLPAEDNAEFKQTLENIMSRPELQNIKRLGRLFASADSEDADEILHVIVRLKPLKVDVTCLVLATNGHQFFTIEIERKTTRSIGQLAKEVKATHGSLFSQVEVNQIPFWRGQPVNISHLDAALELAEETCGSQPLPHSADVCGASFPSDTECFIIKIPGVLPNSDQIDGEEEDIVKELNTCYDRALRKALTLSPSESAKSGNFATYQTGQDPIFDGRYNVHAVRETKTLPIQLYHPAFAQFLNDVNDEQMDIPTEVLNATADLMYRSSGLYSNEGERVSAINKSLIEAICASHGLKLEKVTNRDKINPDSMARQGENCTLLREAKNNLGDGGSDPSTQTATSYIRYIKVECTGNREDSCCPAFLLADAGPWFVVLGAVFTGRVIVQRLTDFMWIADDTSLNEPRIHRIARVFHSLGKGVATLNNFYRDLRPNPPPPGSLHARFFPSIRSYADPSTQHVVQFTYVRPLELDPTCSTFLATTDGPDSKHVVVKFVERYGYKVHELLAADGMAPQLFYHGEIRSESGTSYGALRMVVMEYMEGVTLSAIFAQKHPAIPSTLKDDIKNILSCMHERNFVFGDLRPPNVMITNNGRVMLIDFDWSGKEGEVRYPIIISRIIPWHREVEGLALIKKDHDTFMLGQLI